MISIPYRPEIDGLRALAILPVLIFHLEPSWLPGGFVGVDVFFVISGYLITSIILKEFSGGVFTFRNFWMRRVRRIAPAMLLMLLVSLIAGYFVLFGVSWRLLGWQSISALILSANMLMWRLAHGYWGPAAETLPLLHTWTLSIEEQFYLIYPLLIVACLKWFPKKLSLCLAATFALSSALCIVATIRFPSEAFYFLPTRAWELAGGCFVAALAQKRNQESRSSPCLRTAFGLAIHSWLAIVGLALIAAGWFVINGKGFPGYIALLPVGGSMLVIQFAGGAICPVTSLLSIPIIRFIGKISYSLYLWHWPVIVVGRAVQIRWDFMPTWPFIALIPILAILAYYMVELPGRRLRNPLPFVIPSACAVAALSASLIFLKPSYNLSAFAPTLWMGYTYDVAPSPIPLVGQVRTRLESITKPLRDPKYAKAYAEGGIVKQYGGQELDVLLLGNSHALMWAPVIDAICQEKNLTVLFYAADAVEAFPAIPPQRKAEGTFSPEEWFAFDSNRMKLIKERHPRLVIVAGTLSSSHPDNKVVPFLEEVSSQRSEVLFIEDPPVLAIGGVNAPQFVCTTGLTAIKARNLSELDDSTSTLRDLSSRFKCLHSVETGDLYVTKGDRVRATNGDCILYIDDNHLSLAGAGLAKERISREMSGILAKSPPN